MTTIALPLASASFKQQVEFRLLKTKIAASIAPASLARAVCGHMQQIADSDLNKALYFARLMAG